MMNGSAEDSRTSVATVWVSLHNSLSLQSSSPSLYQTLLLTAVLHCGLLNLIIGLLPASFTPLLFLLKTLMTLILQCSCIVQTHPGPPTHILCAADHSCVSVWVLVLLSCLRIDYESVGWLESNSQPLQHVQVQEVSICLAMIGLRWAEHCGWSVNISSRRFSCKSFGFKLKLSWNVFLFILIF